ncbi:MAG: IMS domain-containing protein [Actinomycetota bacterium]
MLIPLDYYRILGLPIQATVEQLQQAHRDRTLQLPRREYSEVAIVARKQLLDEAYAVLSDPEQRQAYDASFLAKTYDLDPTSAASAQDQEQPLSPDPWATDEIPDPHTPSIEISDDQFVGALLILQELGEYELVLKLGRPYLSSSNFTLKEGRFGDPQFVRPDIVLTVALANLELGREQWQQGQYENAATSLEVGQDLLLRESLFATLRGEMQADLYKLRPYRILELLARPVERVADRHRGLQILREMIQERGGIDGSGDDQSGLSIEDFLRFMQQLRKHLTATEQQNIFEAEARRPSAVATYLAVYTLLAQGFTQRQPASIRRAKLLLMQLGRRQDVHLEKAVCALLLGQTEEASRALELSQEQEPIAFIRENSQGSPDLLPGLCLYAEHWLQEEVFPHFRDLANQSASLKDYFADEQVQAYLEALPTETEAANEWVVVQPRRLANTTLQATEGQSAGAVASAVVAPYHREATTNAATVNGSALLSATPGSRVQERRNLRGSLEKGGNSTATLEKNPSEAVRRQQLRERKRGGTGRSRGHGSLSRRSRLTLAEVVANVKSLPAPQLAAIAGVAVLGMVIIGFLTVQVFLLLANALQSSSGPRLQGEQALVQLDRPPIDIPKPEKAAPSTNGPLTDEVGKQVIEKWLAAKRAALGPDHSVNQLNQILVDPALSRWVQMAEAQQRNNAYQRYQHSIQVNSAQVSDTNPDRGQVEVEVKERAELFDRGQLGGSRDDTLRVRYDLVRQDGNWHIRDWEVLKN